MKKQRLKKFLSNAACSFLSFGMAIQVCIPAVYAVLGGTIASAADVAESRSLKDDFSKNGNVVTEYVNDEDKETKTIIWAKGIEPPKIGGENSEFKKQYTYDGNGNVAYIDYIAPYIPGKGWYDINKSENFGSGDLNLCFAAASSNSLHWWMDQNAGYIDRYLKMNPDNQQIQKLESLRNSFENQHKSGVYDIFLRQFANKQEGYWPDILQDQFINGYYPKANEGTNDSPADVENFLPRALIKTADFSLMYLKKSV